MLEVKRFCGRENFGFVPKKGIDLCESSSFMDPSCEITIYKIQKVWSILGKQIIFHDKTDLYWTAVECGISFIPQVGRKVVDATYWLRKIEDSSKNHVDWTVVALRFLLYRLDYIDGTFRIYWTLLSRFHDLSLIISEGLPSRSICLPLQSSVSALWRHCSAETLSTNSTVSTPPNVKLSFRSFFRVTLQA